MIRAVAFLVGIAAAVAMAWHAWSVDDERVLQRVPVRRGSPFRCDGPRCIQRYPAVPDTGEWECVEMAGVAYCKGGEPAAGVYRRSAQGDAFWVCGARRTAPSERICVDIAPETPDEHREGWRCEYRHEATLIKRCERSRGEPRIGASCGAAAQCPTYGRCVGGRCIAPSPQPNCWFDRDCAHGDVCVFGSCTREVKR